MFMFSGGFLEMAFGMLRCISILTVRKKPHKEVPGVGPNSSQSC